MTKLDTILYNFKHDAVNLNDTKNALMIFFDSDGRSSKLDLQSMSDSLDAALERETPESLNVYLEAFRNTDHDELENTLDNDPERQN